MEKNDFDDLLNQANEIRKALARAYKDVTGEDLDLEGAFRHYPLLAIGVSAGVGAVGGWWIARRGRAAELSSPAPPPAVETSKPLQYLEGLLPGTAERMRERLPEITVPEEMKQVARSWFDNVVEPRLRQNLDHLAAQVDETLGGILRSNGHPADDVELEDPEEA